MSTWNKVWEPVGGLLQTKRCGHAVGDVLLDCRGIAPSDIKKFFLIKRGRLLRWKKKHIEEVKDGVV